MCRISSVFCCAFCMFSMALCAIASAAVVNEERLNLPLVSVPVMVSGVDDHTITLSIGEVLGRSNQVRVGWLLVGAGNPRQWSEPISTPSSPVRVRNLEPGHLYDIVVVPVSSEMVGSAVLPHESTGTTLLGIPCRRAASLDHVMVRPMSTALSASLEAFSAAQRRAVEQLIRHAAQEAYRGEVEAAQARVDRVSAEIEALEE